MPRYSFQFVLALAGTCECSQARAGEAACYLVGPLVDHVHNGC